MGLPPHARLPLPSLSTPRPSRRPKASVFADERPHLFISSPLLTCSVSVPPPSSPHADPPLPLSISLLLLSTADRIRETKRDKKMYRDGGVTQIKDVCWLLMLLLAGESTPQVWLKKLPVYEENHRSAISSRHFQNGINVHSPPKGQVFGAHFLFPSNEFCILNHLPDCCNVSS